VSTVRTDRRGGGDPSVQMGELRRTRRKLVRNGNSLTVAVPPEFLSWMRLLPGDLLEMTYDPEWDGFFVRAARPHVFRPAPSPVPPPLPRVDP